MPEWMQYGLAGLNALGLMGATAWTWWVKRRDKAHAKTSKPYRELFKELAEKLETAQQGFQLLQEEHVTCRVQLARMEERVAALEKLQP